MSVDFSNLSALNIEEKTVDFTIDTIQLKADAEYPVLEVVSATESNKQYMNGLLKKAARNARKVQRGQLNVQILDENRGIDRELYPKFVVKNWRNIYDASGAEVPFSQCTCADFLNSLPNWLFDELRNFCGQHVNFLQEDIEEKVKN